MTKKMSYDEAFNELQALVNEIESGKISIDQLSDKVKRASELIHICKTKLSTTEEDVKNILKKLEEGNEI